jgi:hypothetical protein
MVQILSLVVPPLSLPSLWMDGIMAGEGRKRKNKKEFPVRTYDSTQKNLGTRKVQYILQKKHAGTVGHWDPNNNLYCMNSVK